MISFKFSSFFQHFFKFSFIEKFEKKNQRIEYKQISPIFSYSIKFSLIIPKFLQYFLQFQRFLKAKVTILQQELDLSHQENVKNLDNLSKAIDLQKKTELARCHANNTINTLNVQIQKLQQNEMNITLKLKVSHHHL